MLYQDTISPYNTNIWKKSSYYDLMLYQITSLCIPDDVTMVDACKHSTPTSSTHVKKKLSREHISQLGKRKWIYTVIVDIIFCQTIYDLSTLRLYRSIIRVKQNIMLIISSCLAMRAESCLCQQMYSCDNKYNGIRFVNDYGNFWLLQYCSKAQKFIWC